MHVSVAARLWLLVVYVAPIHGFVIRGVGLSAHRPRPVRAAQALPSVATDSRRSNRGVQMMAWEKFVDDESGFPYYYNTQTGETTWEKPAIEKPKVGGGTRTLYREGTAAAPANTGNGGGTRLVSKGGTVSSHKVLHPGERALKED